MKYLSLQAEMVAYIILFWTITLVRALLSLSHFQGISARGAFMLQEPLGGNYLWVISPLLTVLLHGELALVLMIRS